MISGILRSGDLDRRIIIQKLTVSKVQGAPAETWTDLIEVWASKEELSGSETPVTGADTAFGSVRWSIRYTTKIITPTRNKEAMRLTEVDTGITYEIKYIEELGRKVGWAIQAERWS